MAKLIIRPTYLSNLKGIMNCNNLSPTPVAVKSQNTAEDIKITPLITTQQCQSPSFTSLFSR